MSARDIIAICQRHLPLHPDDCSGFVRAVAQDCGVLVTGDANALANQFRYAVRRLPDGAAAATSAAAGDLVLAGTQGADHGHVAVVVSGPVNRNKYPYAFWGQYHGVTIGGVTHNVGFTRGHGTLNWAFNAKTRDSVVYAAFSPMPLLMRPAGPNEGYLLYTFT